MASCAHCLVTIVDPTTQVVHGDMLYCCPNCSAAMEQSAGGGSDPRPLQHPGDFACAHCQTPIVDEATMVSRGDLAYCCGNCAAAA